MKMNARMARYWAGVADQMGSVQLNDALADLAASQVVDHMGAIVLKALLGQDSGAPLPNDLVGFEAGVNKVHVSDYMGPDCQESGQITQGMRYAEALIARLTSLRRRFRVILSRDPDSGEVTVRFFVRRANQVWGSDEPNDYAEEEVVQWDLGGPGQE
jgi:hypothetical protein